MKPMNLNNPRERSIDFSNCKTLGELHEQIKNGLELPDFYGGNLDALWDALTGLMELPARIKIKWKPKDNPCAALNNAVESILAVFQEARDEYGQITLILER